MSAFRAVAAACATVLATGAFAAPPADPAVPDIEPIVRALDARVLLAEGQALSVDRQAIAAIPEDRKQVLRNVPLTAIRSVDLEVERMVSPFSTATCVVVDRFGRTVPIPRPEVELFAGTVAGQPESRVFLSFAGEAAQGFVEFAGEKFVLASGSPEDPHPPAFFDTKSAAWQEIEWRPWSCNAISVPGFDEEVPVDGDASLMPTCRVIQLALDTDTQYLGRFNGNTTNAANYAAILVAATNWIYQAQASAIFQVTYLRLWSTPDPWTATDSLAALCQFRDYWNANMGSVGRDTAHLLLGTSVGGGIAYVGGICASGYSPDCGSSGSVSYGLSGGLNGSFPTPVASNSFGNWDLFVFAHELGHICGASHTFALSPPYDNCPSNCSNASTIGTIMSYCHQCPGGSSNIALTFAPPNVSQINSYVGSRSCVHTQECQSDPNCVLAATPATSLVPVAGQTVSVTVSGLYGSCSFAPTGLPSWITLGPGATAGTSGTLSFVVAANPGTADRTATIAIGARTHALTQMGSDRDGDGVPNGSDNCVLVANPGQHDGDGDGFGNECDNCPLLANASQADANADGVGDACSIPNGYSQTVNLGSVTVGGVCSPALSSPLAAAPGARIVAFTFQFGFTGNGNFSYASDVALGILGKQWGGYDCILPGHEWVRSWTTIPASGQSGTYAETVTGINLPMASAGAIRFANGWEDSDPVAYTNVMVTLQIQGAEPDSDGDGLPDQLDNCPGVASLDRSDFDGDGRGDACDECPTDPAKIEPGSCGCGQPDSDGDGDGIPDCEDNFCDAPSWLAGLFGNGGPSGTVLALARIGDDLYAGGAFQSIGAVNAQGLARLRTVSGVPAWSPLGTTGINSQTAYLDSTGTVRALLATGGVLYAGGDFYTVDYNSSCRGVARWDPAAAGGAGQWSSLGSGVWKSNGLPAEVNAIAELGGRIYVAGSFNRAGSLTVNNIACWDPAANGGAGAWSALGAGITSAGTATQKVNALAAFGGRLYVGGQFATAGTLGVSSLACWDPAANAGAGAWSAVGAGLSGSTVIVNALAPYGTRLAIGGSFTGAGGAGASNLAAWDPTAGTWLSMTVLRTNNTVQALAVQGDALLVGGWFTTAGPLTVNGVGSYRVSTNAWTALEQGFMNSTGPNVYALLPVVAGANVGVYAGGGFSRTATSYPANLAYWQSDSNRWTPVAAGGGEDSGLATVKGSIIDSLGHAGRLFVCGYLTDAGGLAANGIVAWNPAGAGGLGAWESLGGGLTGGSLLNGGLEMVELGGDLYVTGEFTHAGGQPAANIARWDPSANLGAGAWKALGSGLNGSGTSLAVHGGVLYVGGSFTSAGGVSVSNIARWDPAANSGQGAWSAVGSGVNSWIHDLAVHGGRIYAGGDFTTAGGAAASRIACWTPGTGTSGNWSSLGTGCDSTVAALASFGGSLYVGGNFSQAGAMSANRLARWTPAASGTGGTWSTVSENGEQGVWGTVAEVRALWAFDGRLYIGGRFASAGGVYSKDVVMWDDRNRFTAMGRGTHLGDLSHRVRDFTEFQGRIYAVGDFAGMRNSSDAGQGAITSAGIASWGCPDQPTARPWTPGELAGVQAWFSPDTIRFDQGSGQYVPSWPSSVGSVTVASPNPWEWPRTSIGASGRKALWFDGVDDGLAAGPTDLLRNVTGASAFTVRSFSDVPVSIQSFLHLSNGTSLSSPRLILRASATGRPESGVRRTDSAVTAIARSSSGVSEDFQIQGVVADFGQGSVRQFVNGAAAGQASISTGSSSNTPSLGLALGRTVNGTQRFAGSLAEAIIVGRALTVDERTRVEGYLAHRYDLADALPASHAYRHEAPTVEGDCSFTLAATSQTIPWTVGSSSLTVIANAYTCGWTVATDADWITLGLVGSVGSGSRTVAFTVSANLGDAPRVGTISIAGLVHTVTQEAACLGSFASSGSHVAATDGEGSVWFSTSGTSCAWTVSSDAPWLTLVDAPSTPTGTAEVRFAFAANGTGAARAALLTATVGGVPVEHHVTQAAPCAGTFGFESSVGHPGVAGYPNARIDVLEEVGGDLYAAGEFSSIGGVSASGIARRDGTTGQWLPLGSGLRGGGDWPPFSMQNIVAIGNRVYALGGFQQAGDLAGPLPGLAAWDTQLETWTTVGTDPPLGNFGSMVAHAGCLYVNGIVGAGQKVLGRFHPGRSEWSLVEGLPPASFLGAIASVRGRLHVAGWFPVEVDGVPTSRVRILSQDPQTGAWSVVFDASEEEASIESLFEFGGELHATGTFHYDGGLDPEPVVRFPTGEAGWLPLGGGAPWAGSARHGRSWNGKLCVTGRELEFWGNGESSLLAVFDPANGTWQRTTLAYRTEAIPWLDDPAFAPVGDRLWIGGVLPAVRGVPVNGLAAFRCGPDEYSPCVFGPDFPWSVDLEPGQYNWGDIAVDMANPWCDWYVQAYEPDGDPWNPWLSVEGGGPGDGSIHWSTPFVGCAENREAAIIVSIRRPFDPWGDLERSIDASAYEVWCQSLAFTTKSTTVGSEGGEGQATLAMSCDDCDWSVTSDSDWIEIVEGEGYGDDSADGSSVERIILFAVAANMGLERTATLTSFDGRTLVVTQESGLVPWTPAVLSGVGAWFRADAIPEADRADGLVSRWIDSTGGFDLTATGSARPQFIASGLSGRPTVRFDGTDDALTRGSTALLNGKPGATMYTVRSFAAVPTAVRTVAFLSTGSAGNAARLAVRGSASGKPETAARRADGGTTVVATGTDQAATTAQLHGAVADFAGNLVTQFVDGSPAGTATPTAGSTSATNAASFALGRAGTGSNFHAGEIAEAIVVERALSTADRQRLEGYLAHRWGLAASLPASHPYRNAPPVYVVPCTVANLAHDAANEGPAAGTGEVWVSTDTPACGWTATSSDSWLSIDAPVGGQGVGSGWLGYSFAANATGSVRTATISIAVEGGVSTLTVTQQPSCPSGLGWEVGFANPGLRGPSGDVGYVNALQSLGGSLYAAGSFTQAGGQPAVSVARWNPATSTWSPLGSGLNSGANAFATIGGQLYVGGSFTTAGGAAANGVARWDPATSTWSALGAGLTGPSASVRALAEVDGRLYAGGRFVQSGSILVSNVARWEPSSNSWLPLGTVGAGVDGVVRHAVGCRGKLYVSGEFDNVDGLEAPGIACWDPATGQWSTLPGLGEGWLWTALASIRGTLYAGAILVGLDEYGSQADSRVLRWDPTAGAWVSMGYLGAREPQAIAEFGGELLVAGLEFLGPGYELPSLHRRDPATGTWSDNAMAEFNQLAWEGLQIYQRASSLAVLDGGLFVGGSFTGVLGVHADSIARFRCGPDEYQQCLSLALSSTSVSVPNGGSQSGSVTVDLANPWCRWEVETDPYEDWISMTDSGIGDGTIDWMTDFDGCAGANSAYVPVVLFDPYGGVIDEVWISFSQASVACVSSSFVSSGSPLPAAGGDGSASLVMSCERCDWSVTSDSAWLTVTDGEGFGFGNGSGAVRTILFTAAPNAGPARTATLTAQDGRTLVLVQASGAVPWTPSSLPGMGAWFRSDAIPDADRVGNLVSRWADSANAFHLLASGTARPQYIAAGLSGKPTVKFDGSNDALTRGATALLNAKPGATVFAVRKFTAVPTAVRTLVFLSTGTAGNAPRVQMRGTATGKPESAIRRADTGTTVLATGQSNATTGFQLHGVVADFTGNTASQWIDGAVSGTAVPTAGLTNATNAMSFTLGRAGTGASYFAGELAEVLVVERAVTALERQRIEGYLAHRWGLAASLPANHPHRDAPPTTGGPSCTYTLAQASASVPAIAGSGTVSLTASAPACAWTATSGASWLSVSPASGTGGGTLTFSHQANPDVAVRTGTITIAGQTFTVTQAEAACSYALSATSASVPATAGSGTFTVTANGASCAWTATSGASWLSVSPESGAGGGTVTFSHLANPSGVARTGTITVGGQAFAVNQQAHPAPANDECANAIAIGPGVTPFDNRGAVTGTDNGPGCLEDGSTVNRYDVWFRYTATGSGEVTISTCGQTTIDTRISIFAACGDAAPIACNDQFCGNQSQVFWTATVGTTYWISLGSWSIFEFGTGTLTLTTSFPSTPNDECANAIAIGPGVTPFDTSGAQTGTDNGPTCLEFGSTVNFNDVWFAYTASADGEVTISTCGQSTLDTKLSVFANCGDGTPIACNDDDGTCDYQSSVAFLGTAGTRYLISLGSYGPNEFGTGTLTLTAPSPPWTPEALATLEAWYKADAIPEADRAGNVVTRWVDSKSSFDVTATGTAAPQFVAAAQAGRPVVRFDGVNDGLGRGTASIGVSATGGTMYAVRKFAAVPTSLRSVAWVSTGTASTTARMALRGNSTGKPETILRRLDADAGITAAGATNVATTAFEIHGMVTNWGGGTASQFVNGTAAGTATFIAGATSGTSSASVGIGRSGSATGFFQGDIAEVVIVKQALSTCERQKLEGYLAHRWGLAASLPATHPFRNAPPTQADSCGSSLVGDEPAGEGVATIEVPAETLALQPWVDAAPDGATLRVPAGTYAGGLSVAGKSLVIESDAGAAVTVLDGGGQVGTVVTVTDGASVALRGFTIRGGFGGTPVDLGDGVVRLAGGGVLVREASASLVECIVEGNLAGFGGGVAAVDASVEAVASEIRGNHAAHDGGGLWSSGSVASLLGGAIRGNVAGAAGGGVHADAASALEAHATSICDNQPDEAQGEVGGEPGACSACAADLDGDGAVGSGDLAVLFAAWGTVDLPFDLDGDGAVSGGDVSVVFAAWGTACGE